MLALILPFKSNMEDPFKVRKIDINPFFQMFSFYVLMRDQNYKEYTNIHLLVMLLSLLGSIVYRLALFVPELKVTIELTRIELRNTTELYVASKEQKPKPISEPQSPSNQPIKNDSSDFDNSALNLSEENKAS